MIPLKDNTLTPGTPVLTLALIGLCLLVFCWQVTLSGKDGTGSVDEGIPAVAGGPSERDELAANYGTSPARVAEAGGVDYGAPPWWLSPFTAVPVAADFLHLIVNMLFLLIFGRTLEAGLGRLRYLALVAFAVAAGIGVQALADPDATDLVVGASTALAGVMGAYAILHPRAGVVTISLIPLFGTLLEVPALLLIASWFLIALIPTVGPVVDPGLLVPTGLEFAGYGAALVAGLVAGVLARGRAAARPEAA